MKNILRLSAFLLIICSFCTILGCKNDVPASGLWENAAYTEDCELGSGKSTVKVILKIDEKSITFTLKTDAKTLGEALISEKLIEGEDGPYGLYVKKVNGITADYDVDKAYWGFYKDGALLPTGVDTTEIKNGETYEIVYSR